LNSTNEAITQEALEGALVPVDDRTCGRVESAENSCHFLGLGDFGERREAPQIGENDTDLAAMAAEEGAFSRRHHELRHLAREKASEAGHPLDLGNLRGDASFKALFASSTRGRARTCHGVING
jgi:hypothetical protein